MLISFYATYIFIILEEQKLDLLISRMQNTKTASPKKPCKNKEVPPPQQYSVTAPFSLLLLDLFHWWNILSPRSQV